MSAHERASQLTRRQATHALAAPEPAAHDALGTTTKIVRGPIAASLATVMLRRACCGSSTVEAVTVNPPPPTTMTMPENNSDPVTSTT